MVRPAKSCRTLFAVTALLLAAPCATAQDWPKELEQFQDLLKSEAPFERRDSREMLADAIAKVPASSRPAVIAALIEAVPSQPYRVQLGIAAALSRQPAPWPTRDPAKQTAILYRALLDTLDPTLKRSIDDALANVKGGYRDAITDYNQDRIDDLDAVVEKFKLTPASFPRSRYVANSLFYHAQYLTRAFLLGHSRGSQLVADASTILESLIQNPETAKSTLIEDAHYYLALNRLLLNERDRAVATLNVMEKRFSETDRVYVYQFFFSKKTGTVIDQTFPASVIARRTREFIESARSVSPASQEDFIAYVTK